MASNDFGKKLMDGMVAAVKRELQARFAAIRHPETGEFPTVIIEGDQLNDMRVRIEGSPALLEIVRSRMKPEDLEGVQMTTVGASQPKVFLSYGNRDRDLAEAIAHSLQGKGIDTWWAEWEIGPGDSIRRKIDAGLGQCTHFVVLLTPNSIDRPWVQEEMDAGFVRMVDEQCKFIPLRHQLAVAQLPPLLRGKLSPEVDDAASNLAGLINFIHGVSVKPPLGPAPSAAASPTTSYSPAASAIAEFMVRKSKHGHFADPQTTITELAKETELTEDDVRDAVHEIRHYVSTSWDRVWPKDMFFPEFDKYFMPWDPAADALRVAADLVNDPAFPRAPAEIAERYEWSARRLNSALAFLKARELAGVDGALGCAPYIAFRVRGTDATRRFVKSRS
jgi:hypothetical protein